jgi:proton-dependent oligopeptide transporter, POT family
MTSANANSMESARSGKGWFGHPAGLSTLFFTEMWERLSYYGMRALLLLYMIAPLFSPGEFQDLSSFVEKIKEPKEPVSQFVREQLSTNALALMAGYTPGADATKLQEALVKDLNRILTGTNFYTPERFKNVELTAETRQLLAGNPTEKELIQLNRSLLKAAYPKEIPNVKPGLAISIATASLIYGLYTMLVYALSLPGGIIADRWLGQYRTIFIGGALIAIGQFSLVIPNSSFFFTGLIITILGTGLLKPNMSSMVGSLYETEDPRRDGGFSIYYLGINLGAFFAPLVCGLLAQKVGWHWGFGAAGVGMIFGLIQFRLRKAQLQPAIDRIAASKQHEREVESAAHRRLTAEEWKRLGVIASLFLFSAIFFAAFEQAGSSLNLFADRMTRLDFFQWTIPSTWFQAVNPAFILIFAPVFSWLWIRLGQRQPSSPAKFVYGLLLLSLGFLLLVPAAAYAQSSGQKVSPMWLVGVYLFCTLGELCLSPVGLSMVTKLAPAKMVGSIMGFWFLSNALGNFLSGLVGGLFGKLPLWKLFGMVFIVPFCAGIILLFLVKPLKRMMGGVK